MDKKQLSQLTSRDINYRTRNSPKENFPRKTFGMSRNQKLEGWYGGNYIHQPQRKTREISNQYNSAVNLTNEEFIQANSKIWMSEKCADGHINFTDINENWNSIVQINFKSHEEINCPICMEFPKVPRTDKCGHVYCLPCVIKYLNVDNKKYKGCALCNQSMDIKRLKRASIIQSIPYKMEDNVSLILMKRNRNSFAPVPFQYQFGEIVNINSPNSNFSNVLICPDAEVLNILRCELSALEDIKINYLEDENFLDESILNAIELVSTDMDMKYLCKEKSPPLNEVIDVTYENIEEEIKSSYVYYQEETGDNVFLCPLNWSCLKFEYLDNKQKLPMRIYGKIIDIEKYTVTESFIYRYRYLKYLPVGSVVYFVYVDINDFISDQTIKKFETKINNKMKDKQRKQEIDMELTKKKEEHESSFYMKEKFIHTPSSMKECDAFDLSDFAPLTGAVSNQPNAIKLTQSYAKAMKAPVTPQSQIMNCTTDTTKPSSGFRIADCIQIKPKKK